MPVTCIQDRMIYTSRIVVFSYTIRASALEEMPSDHMKLFTHGSYRTI